MPRILAALLVLLAASPLAAEDLTIRGLERGKSYVIEVAADGAVTVNVTRIVSVGGAPAPGPTDPNQPAGSPFQQEITRQTKTVIVNQGGSKTTGAALSEVYSRVADGLEKGTIPPEKALPAIKAASDLVLSAVDDGPAWDGWRATVSAALAALQQQGELSTKQQYASAFKQVAGGLNAATGYSPAARAAVEKGGPENGLLGGIDIAKIIAIVELIIKLLTLFGGK